MKLSFCQLPDDLAIDHPAWSDLMLRLGREQPDLALLNEMPFGPWVARKAAFEPELAAASVQAHEAALPTLLSMSTAVLSSRPLTGDRKLSNEAFLVADGVYRPIHHKHYFPQGPGFHEDRWFAPTRPGFDVIEYRGVRIGVLLCTELMFSESAVRGFLTKPHRWTAVRAIDIVPVSQPPPRKARNAQGAPAPSGRLQNAQFQLPARNPLSTNDDAENG